jgi:hypothetical protein
VPPPGDALTGKSKEHQQSSFNLYELCGCQTADAALHVGTPDRRQLVDHHVAFLPQAGQL